MRPTINKELLPMKGHFFLFNAGTAPIVPFLPTYAKQLGFSSVVVGTIYTILPVTGMLAKPLFGAVADMFQRQKLLFLIFQLLTAASFFAIHFIPEVPQTAEVSLHCEYGIMFMEHSMGPNSSDCAAEIFADNSDNDGPMSCLLSCEMSPEFIKIMCEDWLVTQKCNTRNKSEIVTFRADISLNKTLSESGNIFFRIHSLGLGDGNKHNPQCPRQMQSTCNATCDVPEVTELISKSSIENSEVTGLYQFWVFFWMLVLSWIGMAVVVSVGDAICFEMLGENTDRYGNQRLWGAVGWGVFSLFAGFLVDEFSRGQVKKNYTVVFYMMLALLMLDVLVSYRLKHTQSKLSHSILKDVGTLLASPRIIVFTLWCITVGLCTGLLWNFLFWHLEELGSAYEDGCNMQTWMKTLQGLVMGIQCFGGELPFFFLSGWILNKITHVHAMSLVLLGFGVRFLLYSVLSNPWLVLPIELLQGVTFGIFYSTMASYAAIVAPPGTEATVQGLVGAIFEGVGVSLGSLLGGFLMQNIGGASTFRIYGISALIFFLLHVIVQRIMDRTGQKDVASRYAAPIDAIHMLDDDDFLQT